MWIISSMNMLSCDIDGVFCLHYCFTESDWWSEVYLESESRWICMLFDISYFLFFFLLNFSGTLQLHCNSAVPVRCCLSSVCDASVL